MANEASTISNRIWNYCNVLKDDGVSYSDYLEQLTFLIFLKMDDENDSLPPSFRIPSRVPETYNWKALRKLEGDALEIQYRHTLENLGKEHGMLGTIFRKAQNKIQDPAKLKRLVNLIEGENWSQLKVDVKSEIYESLLERNAQDTKSGAGQYFTPRDLIKAIVAVMRPAPDTKIHDPASGTGGFLLAAYAFITKNYTLDQKQKDFLREKALSGNEIVDATARLCVMNLYLHGIGDDNDVPINVDDSLKSDPSEFYQMVLTNPPFGKKSSVTIIDEGGKAGKESVIYQRTGFTQTSNKQLNFVQHISAQLETHGRAAVVVPDNVLFEGGAGETIRKKLLKTCDVHTLLRLPTGIFYAQGVKANVIFFDKKPGREEAWTKKLWIYDLRTNKHFTLKTNQLDETDLQDFIECYNPTNRNERTETERFKCFNYDELIQRDKTSLDIFWLKDDSLEDSANLPAPDILAQDILENLQAAMEQFSGIYEELNLTTELAQI
jgi:type I restriction enzyme M protein